MKCKHECDLRNEVAHARNRETRHLAEMGEMASEIVRLNNRINEQEYRIYEMERKCSRRNKSKN